MDGRFNKNGARCWGTAEHHSVAIAEVDEKARVQRTGTNAQDIFGS